MHLQRNIHLYMRQSGVHPDEVGCLNEENFAQMKELFKEEKVVAVGEIGLDYYWDNEPREVQKKWFIRQLELARELDLPVLIHSREAAADTMEIMKEHAKGLSGVIHCYSYSKEMAQEYIKMGFYIGVGGVVNVQECEEAERSSGKYSADINCTRDGLPVYGTGTESWKAQQFCLYPLCGREDCGIKGHYV